MVVYSQYLVVYEDNDFNWFIIYLIIIYVDTVE